MANKASLARQASTKRWQAKNRERVQEQRRQRYQRNLKAQRVRAAAWYRKNRKYALAVSAERQLRDHFGLTLDDYGAILDAQAGVCAICGDAPPSIRKRGTKSQQKRRFAVDHCRKTLAIRGVLCARCNIGLGQFRDDPRLLQQAIVYLGSPPTKFRLPKPYPIKKHKRTK